MKKKILFYILCTILIFPGPARCEEYLRRGLFVTMALEEPPVLSSPNEVDKLIAFAKKAHIKTIFVQIYRANRAWFPSKIADPGPYETGLKNFSGDVFAFLIKKAHGSGIRVHAWLNMLSLSDNEDARLLKKYGIGILTKNLKKKVTIKDYKIDGQYFLEPGDPRIREDLVNIVGEVLCAYPDLDGVQFDYIRYPDKDPAYGYTQINTQCFKKETGIETIEENSQSWKDWKRAQVTGFLELLVKKTRSLRPDIQISVTGCMPYSRAYHEAFQDWQSWLRRGLVDFVTIMSYSPNPREFKEWISNIKAKVSDFKKVNIGIGAYKLARSPETFEQELRFCEESCGGACVIFHYGSLLENSALADLLISKLIN